MFISKSNLRYFFSNKSTEKKMLLFLLAIFQHWKERLKELHKGQVACQGHKPRSLWRQNMGIYHNALRSWLPLQNPCQSCSDNASWAPSTQASPSQHLSHCIATTSSLFFTRLPPLSVVAGQHWSLLYLQGLLTDWDVGGRDLLLSDYLHPGKPWVGGVPLSSAEPRYPCPQHSYRGFLPHHKAPSSGSETQERRGQRGPAQLAWVMTQNSTPATKSRSNNRSYCHPDGDGDALALDGQSLSPFMDVGRGH